MLHHVCDVAYDENMCGPIRTRKCRSTNWLINYMYLLETKYDAYALDSQSYQTLQKEHNKWRPKSILPN